MTDKLKGVPEPEEVPAVEANDPFDLTRARVSPGTVLGARKLRLTVPVRRRVSGQFFRVRPGAEHRADVYVFEREDGMDREIYWVVPELQPLLAGPALKPVRLFTCMTLPGMLFLWACSLNTTGAGASWTNSALECAARAEKEWIKLMADKPAGGYNAWVAEFDHGDPTWPEEGLQELVKTAFAAKLINTADHPVVREFRGGRPS